MRFGIDNKRISFLVLLLVFFVNACSQTRQTQMDKGQEFTESARKLRMQGDFQSALREQLKAVEINPNDDDSLMLLGGIYIDLEQYDKALQPLQKSVQINPQNGSAFYLLSWALGETGKNKEALEAIKKAVEIRPNDLSYLISLGGEYEQTGDKVSAKKTFEKSLQINPKYIPAMYRLGTLEAEEGNIKQATELFEKALSTPLSEENDKTYVDLCKEELQKLKEPKENSKP